MEFKSWNPSRIAKISIWLLVVMGYPLWKPIIQSPLLLRITPPMPPVPEFPKQEPSVLSLKVGWIGGFTFTAKVVVWDWEETVLKDR